MFPEKDEEEECIFVGPIQGYYMVGNDIKSLTNVEAADCKKACEEETSFKCLAFDYNKVSRKCNLQAKNRHDGKLTAHASLDFYERRCNGE